MWAWRCGCYYGCSEIASKKVGPLCTICNERYSCVWNGHGHSLVPHQSPGLESKGSQWTGMGGDGAKAGQKKFEL